MDFVFEAWPMADEALTQEILDFVQQGIRLREVKKGLNEATRAVTRGVSELIVMAGDVSPLAIVMHLPLQCEENNVLYVFVPSKHALGRACGMNRPLAAVTINTNDASELAPQLHQLKLKVERLMI